MTHPRNATPASIQVAIEETAEVLARITLAMIEQACRPIPKRTKGDTSDRPQQTWCWTHQRNTSQCHAHDLDCGGEAMDDLTRNDPTGEAALNRLADHRTRQLATYVHGITTNAANALSFIVSAMPPTAPPDVTQLIAANEINCESCARCKGPNGQPRRARAVSVNDLGERLARKIALCVECRQRALTRHQAGLPALPTEAEVSRRWLTGKWPPMRTIEAGA